MENITTVTCEWRIADLWFQLGLMIIDDDVDNVDDDEKDEKDDTENITTVTCE